MIIKRKVSNVSCYIIPKKDFVQKQAMAVVRFGSDISGFKADNRHFDIPAGTAHFIEHLMFASPEKNRMDKFSDLGAEANAFTSFDRTAYYFTCAENFYENLGLLVKMISSPYFTEENIENERKIITKEINMYGDDPRWQAYFSALKCLYPSCAVSNEIAGKTEDICTVTKDILYNCYDHFYNAANIAVIAAGDIDADKVCESVEKNISLNGKIYVSADEYEKSGCALKYTEKNMDVSVPYLYFGFKEETMPLSAKSIVKMHIMLECLAGECSPLYARLLDEEAVDAPFGFDYIKGKKYGVGMIFGETANPDKTGEYILNELGRTAKNGFKNIRAVIKKQRGELIMRTESLNGVCMQTADCFAKNIDFLDILKLYDKINIDGLCLDMPADIAVSVVKGKDMQNKKTKEDNYG